ALPIYFEESWMALVGTDAGGLSASTIARLKEIWAEEHARWQQRDLSAKRYVYLWADGVYFQARLEDDAQCILVIIRATPGGKKELVGPHETAIKRASAAARRCADHALSAERFSAVSKPC